MSIEHFAHELTKHSLGPGAAWIKADFHVHAPSSSDYEYSSADATTRLGRALDDGRYGFAVVVKHEEFPTRDELKALAAHCPQTTLIPGAEINVFVDALSKKVGKDYFFHCIVAVDPAGPGDYGYVLQKAKEGFAHTSGDYPTGFLSSIVDLGRFFRKNGALFMPAHLHQSKRPDQSRSIDDVYEDEAFLSFVAGGAFDALEVREQETAQFFDGNTATSEGVSIPAAVCVASSDAHHHDHLTSRHRSTWIRAEKKSFAELVAALAFKHRVSLLEPTATHARVLGFHVVGAFLPEAWISLSEGFNALIGSKGSGKTALLECLRFVLNAPIPAERRESVDRHLAHVLGSAGYIECLVQRADETRLLITRRADSRDRITVLDAVRSSNISSGDEMPFPISILGWHEIEAVADKADARIGLLDRIGDAARVRMFYREIRTHIEHARDELPLLQRQVKRLDGILRELWDLQRKRATLARLEEGELLSLQRRYEWFLAGEQALQALGSDSDERAMRLPSMLASQLSLDVQIPDEFDAADEAVSAIEAVDSAIDLQNAVETESVGSLQKSLSGLSEAATIAAQTLSTAFGEFRDNVYTPRVNQLEPSDREILSKQIQVLEETKRLPLVERDCGALLGEVRTLAEKLRTGCDAIAELRRSVVAQRESLVQRLNNELPGVHLKLLPSANQEAGNRFQARHGQDGANLVGFLKKFGRSESYENLRALFDKLVSLDRDQAKWDITDTLWDVRLVELLDVFDDDDLEIALAVGKAGFVPMQNLSSGQRAVAVFPLLLRNSKGPLVIDQPEDNLDNRYIADVIAVDLLDGKRRQQYLVTSHNANLVVLSDADLIIHVDADGTRASFPAAGFLSCSTSEVRDAVLGVLDGGEAALAARQRKYATPASV